MITYGQNVYSILNSAKYFDHTQNEENYFFDKTEKKKPDQLIVMAKWLLKYFWNNKIKKDFLWEKTEMDLDVGPDSIKLNFTGNYKGQA